METSHNFSAPLVSSRYIARPVALGLAAAMIAPTLAGCGGQPAEAPVAPANRPPAIGAPRMQQNTGMSTKKKVMLLAGAAALYYMYKKHKNAQGQAVQYYQSKSTGRIYYRDPKNPQKVTWVTPPTQPIQVPADQAQEYSNYQGYNNQTTGQAWGGFDNGQFAPGSDRM